MEPILIDCVQNSLRHFMFRNAIFMCERLVAEFPSETNLQLLAGCYLQNNQAYAAYFILKGTQMAQSRYLFAISCFQMDLLKEAEAALCPANEVPNGAAGHYLLGLIYRPLLNKVLLAIFTNKNSILLASWEWFESFKIIVCSGIVNIIDRFSFFSFMRYTDRKIKAVNHFKQALLMDPLLWAAYEELCALGSAEDATTVFNEAAALCIQKQLLYQGSASQNSQSSSEDRNMAYSKSLGSEEGSPRQSKHLQGYSRDITGNNHGAVMSGGAANKLLNSGLSNASFYNTPSPITAQIQNSGLAPPPLCRNLQPNGPNPAAVCAEGFSRSTVNSTIQAPRRKFVDEGKLRKISGRLFSDSGPRRSTRLAAEGVNSNSSSTTITGNGIAHSSKYIGATKLSSVAFRSVTVRKGQSWANDFSDEGMRHESFDDSRSNMAVTSSTSPAADAKTLEQGTTLLIGGALVNSSRVLDGASEILGLMRMLGEGLRLSSVFRCQDALDAYSKLPQKHYNTGWVLSQVGKAYSELVDYLQADRIFSVARQTSPHSLEGMDMHSIVLYHLKEDMKLSYLAQELISTDRLAPQSWCAMGNCYSLQKDHEAALKNFQRAVQLNARFAYAHTLCGHEYVALEDFENGIKSYQNALRIDSRHYKAWYGLGMIYLRQEKFEFAEHHLRMAFQINPHSSVIMCYLGTALHHLKRCRDALEMMEKAILADKKNPVPMYQKANILFSIGGFDEALEVLEELKEHSPCESSVYALMGRIYKRWNMHEKAMLHFGLALDLKPPASDVATIKAAIEKLNLPDELEDNL